MKSDERVLKELVDQSIPTPSYCELEIRCDRVLQKLQSGDIAASEFARLQPEPIRASWKPWRVAVVSVATVLALLGGLFLAIPRPNDSAIAKSTDGTAYKVGETFRSISGNTVIALVDGSRIEMRSGAEASVEHAPDGLSVHLTAGGVIVNAAKQTHGRHLYVKTKDVTVSVLGTIFLVNVEAEGSSVAVLEGEVRVVSGGTSKTLRRGEQFLTQVLRETQSTKGPAADVRTAAVSTQPAAVDRFEVATVRPSSPSAGGAGARGAGAAAGPPRLQIEHHRFTGTNVTLHRLITFAYDLRGLGVDRVSGGPGWIRSDQFDIQALTPDDAPDYTTQRLLVGDVPKLRLMVRDLLADRFKLTLHNVVKEMPIYNLVAIKGGRLKVSDDQTPPDPSTAPQPYLWGAPLRRGAIVLMSTPGGRTVSGAAIPITTFSNMLQEEVGRVIVDNTGLHGLFDINLEFAAEPTVDPTIAGQPISSVPAIFTAIQEQLGLKLESANGRVELLMIDHAEKPVEK